MENLLFEIGVEEIPAQYIKTMANSFKTNAKELFNELLLNYQDINVYYTPRRLVLYITNLNEYQNDIKLQIKGPNVKVAFDENKNPSRALEGFLNKNECSIEDIKINGEYVFIDKTMKGKNVKDVLKDNLEHLVSSIFNPNPMRWGEYKTKFIRPIRWLCAMYGNSLIPVTLECAISDKYTYGHRTLKDGKIEIDSAASYFKVIRDSFVIVDQEERKNMILDQIKTLENKYNFKAELDEDLLDEITNIVEYPTCEVGSFDESYLSLPECVIKNPLKNQQRYFPVYKDNKILNKFIFVRNGDSYAIDNVISGNERVLKPRLADATFFYENDCKTSMMDKVKELENVVFVDKAGTYKDKSIRVKQIANKLIDTLKLNINKNTINTAIDLQKADLVSSVVREYTDIQGEVGAVFAKNDGYEENICIAIKEQYLPKFVGDTLPSTPLSSIIAIADKLDSILTLSSVGLKLSTSADPYGRRRQILGIYLIINDNKFDINLSDFIDSCKVIYQDIATNSKVDIDETFTQIKEFFTQRISNLLVDQFSYSNDEILSINLNNINFYRIINKLEILKDIKNEDYYNKFITISNRVSKLIKNVKEIHEFDINVIDEEASTMFNKFRGNRNIIIDKIDNEDYIGAIKLIAENETYINSFMDNCLVMCDNVIRKNNRIAFFYDFISICRRIINI